MKFTDITIREKITSRGGGIEIDLTSYGFEGGLMSAYQNYLGGGMLGRIMVNDNLNHQLLSQPELDLLEAVGEDLKKHLYDQTDPGTEWEGRSYEQNQKMPGRAY